METSKRTSRGLTVHIYPLRAPSSLSKPPRKISQKSFLISITDLPGKTYSLPKDASLQVEMGDPLIFGVLSTSKSGMGQVPSKVAASHDICLPSACPGEQVLTKADLYTVTPSCKKHVKGKLPLNSFCKWVLLRGCVPNVISSYWGCPTHYRNAPPSQGEERTQSP